MVRCFTISTMNRSVTEKSCFRIVTGTDSYPHDNGIVRALNAHYKPNERVTGSAKHTIFIGRLHPRTDEVIAAWPTYRNARVP